MKEISLPILVPILYLPSATKKIATSTLETSYRQPDQVKSILDDFTAY